MDNPIRVGDFPDRESLTRSTYERGDRRADLVCAPRSGA